MGHPSLDPRWGTPDWLPDGVPQIGSKMGLPQIGSEMGVPNNNCLQLLKSKGDMKEQLADRDQTRDWSLLGILNLRHLDSIHNTKVHKKKQSLIKLGQ